MSVERLNELRARKRLAELRAKAGGEAPAPQSDAVGAAIEGFGQGASMGYLPQLQAAVGSVLPSGSDDVDADLAAQGFTIDQAGDDYLSRRDESIARQEALSKSNPYIYNGSQLAGMIATAPAVEMGVAKALPAAVRANRFGHAVATGATIGGVQNPGDETGEIAALQLKKRAENAALGGAVGGGADILARGASKVANAVKNGGQYVREAGEANALRSAGAQKGQVNKLNKKGRMSETANFVMENDLGNPGLTGKELQGKVRSLKSEAASEIGSVMDEIGAAGEAGTFNRKEIAEKMRTTLLEDAADSIDADSLLPKFEKYIDDFERKSGPASAKDIQSLRQQFDSKINFEKRRAELPESEKIFKSWRRLFSNEVDQKATQIGGKAGERLRAANKKYSLASEVEKLAENKVSQQGNNAFGLTDRIAGASIGGAGAMTGEDWIERLKNAGIGAVAGAAGSKALRTYGPTLGTKALLSTARGIERIAPAAAAAERVAQPVAQRLRLAALESDAKPTRKKLRSSRAKRVKALEE